MINIQFNLRVPGCDRFKNIKCWHGVLPFIQHKFWELQIYQGSDVLDLFLRVTHKQSHAGIEFGLGFLGINVEFQIYDNRHWNKELKTWSD